MSRKIKTTLALAALLTVLAACGNAPQQPSDIIDDRSRDAIQGDTSGGPDSFEADRNAEQEPIESGTITPADTAIATSEEIAAVAGVWGPSVNECGLGDELRITTTRVEGAGRDCDVVNAISKGSAGGVTLTLQCRGPAGEMDSQLLNLSPVAGADAIDINIVGGSAPDRLMRCP